MTIKKSIIIFGALVAITGQLLTGSVTNAINPADFQAGRIIDDELFYNKDAMSVSEIQAFLNAHVPVCDTWGTQPSGYGNLTRAQYAQQIMGWHGPPYSCLNNYHENPDTGATSFENGGGAFSGGISAAQIIYNAAQQYGISPKALMVLLRKEALNIYGDSWPLKSQYKYAMGYACPDSGPGYSAACTESKAGFYKQMTLAAWQLRYYYNNMGTYNFAPGRWNTIQYDVDPACGTKQVFIQNYATASLYIYTPYTPTTAALNAYPGSAEPCGAYGNRNFWFMWQEWFGSPYGTAKITSPLSVQSEVNHGLFTKRPVTASFTIKNESSQRLDIGTMAIGVRDKNNVNFDFGSQRIVLNPYESYAYTATRYFDNEGEYTFSIINYREAEGWSSSFPESINAYARNISNAKIMNAPSIATGPAIDNSTALHVGQQTIIRMTAKNNSSVYPANLGRFGVAITSPTGKNADLQFDTVSSLGASSNYEYFKAFTPLEAGVYKARVSSTSDNGVTWSEGRYPVPEGSATNRLDINVKSNPTLTQGLSLDRSTIYVGDAVNGSFSVKNFSSQSVTINKKLCMIVRGQSGVNNDFGCLDIGTLSAGQVLTYTGSRTFLSPGSYTALFSMYDGRWNDNWTFEKETGAEPTSVNFIVKSNPTLIQGLVLNTQSIKVGDTVQGTFKVKNNANSSVIINKKLCMIVRGQSSGNNDFGCLDVGTLTAGQELTYTGSRTFLSPGSYTALFSMYDGKYWYDNWTFEKDTGTEPTSLKFTVKSNPTLTQGLTMSSNLSEGDTATGTFAVTNSSSSAVTVNKKLCYIVRDAQFRNFDLGCLDIGSMSAGQTLTFTGSRILPAGQYKAYFSMYDGKYWYDNWSFEKETGSEPTAITINVKGNPQLSQGLTLSNPTPATGELITGTFKVRNTSKNFVTVNKKLCYIVRDAQFRNFDLGCLNISTIDPESEITFSGQRTLGGSGQYKAYFSMFDGKYWHDNWVFDQMTGSEPKSLTFTVSQ